MTLTKKDIIKLISKIPNTNSSDAESFLNKFIYLIKDKSQNNIIKIKNFGTFKYRKTPKRIGRNPKTKESYIIRSREKLHLTISNEIKKTLN